MRKREEIEADLKHWAEKDSDREYAFAEWRLILETLLDIRELLTPPQPVVIKMTEEEQREFMTKWNQVTKGG